jgi:hypothetical protein
MTGAGVFTTAICRLVPTKGCGVGDFEVNIPAVAFLIAPGTVPTQFHAGTSITLKMNVVTVKTPARTAP